MHVHCPKVNGTKQSKVNTMHTGNTDMFYVELWGIDSFLVFIIGLLRHTLIP